MNLVIDVGNTYTKIGVFSERKLIHHMKTSDSEHLVFEQILNDFSPIKNGIISIVGRFNQSILQYLTSKIEIIELSHQTKIPVINNYGSPQTLGYDRLAAVIGASALYPDTNLLVIDAGTCITYDFVTSDKIYKGGGISPGITLRFKSLNDYTSKIPLLKPQEIMYLIGNNTEQSVLSGVMNGTIEEIKGIIDLYSGQYEKLKVVMTGGDLVYFEKTLKNIIFAVPNLVLYGLNEILEHHAL